MKKLVVLIVFLFVFLGACSSGETVSSTSKEKKEEPKKEEAASKKDTDEESSEEQVEEEETPAVVEPEYVVNENTWTIDPIKDANKKVALLTFDDSPDEHAVKIAEDLKEMGVGAIFFVNGHFLQSDEGKEKLKKIHDMGFEIGNHTYNHSSLKDLTPEEQRKEIVELNDLVESIIGERPVFFRAPFGQNTDESREVVKEEKMTLMNWTYGYDWEKAYQSKAAISDIMVNSPYLGDGANLLMHDRTWTAEAVPDIVKGLQDKGFEILDPAKIKTIE
jgi:peptidoglycan-N-acetylglucosamine deacetylase